MQIGVLGALFVDARRHEGQGEHIVYLPLPAQMLGDQSSDLRWKRADDSENSELLFAFVQPLGKQLRLSRAEEGGILGFGANEFYAFRRGSNAENDHRLGS